MRCIAHVALGGLIGLSSVASTATAEPAALPDVRLAIGTFGSNLDVGGELRLTVDLDDAVRLGLRVRGIHQTEAYVAGFEEDEANGVEALPYASLRIARFGAADLRLRIGAGARQSFLDSVRDDATTRLMTEVGPMIHWRLDPAWRLRIGWIQRADLELAPTTDLAVLGSIVRAGVTASVAERWSIYAEAEVGGVFGYGGDNEKVQARGAIGLQVALDAPAYPPKDAPATAAQTVGAFVALEWRALLLAGHASHGPGVSAGVRLFDGRLRVGLTGFSRPGPLNPATFEITPAGGATYKGQQTVTLRSDGAFFGLLLESELPLFGVGGLTVIPSVALGNAAFGFYLTGDDRTTPDGRRVSAWEDELQDGKDAGVGFAIEPGLRVAWRPAGRVVGPYVAARYLFLLGYDAFAQDSYDGLSFAGGVEFVF